MSKNPYTSNTVAVPTSTNEYNQLPHGMKPTDWVLVRAADVKASSTMTPMDTSDLIVAACFSIDRCAGKEEMSLGDRQLRIGRLTDWILTLTDSH